MDRRQQFWKRWWLALALMISLGVLGLWQYPLDWYERSDDDEDLLRCWVDAIAGSEYTRAYRAVFKGPSRVDENPPDVRMTQAHPFLPR